MSPPLLNRGIRRRRRPQDVAVAFTSDSHHVLSDPKALRCAPTPLRGADGLDVASARAVEALTATQGPHPTSCGRPLFRIPRFRTTVDIANPPVTGRLRARIERLELTPPAGTRRRVALSLHSCLRIVLHLNRRDLISRDDFDPLVENLKRPRSLCCEPTLQWIEPVFVHLIRRQII
jgi:hypothetical protein